MQVTTEDKTGKPNITPEAYEELAAKLDRTQSEFERLRQRYDWITKTDPAIMAAEIDRLKITVFNQQKQLTQTNKAMAKKVRQNKILRGKLGEYQKWAASDPMDKRVAIVRSRRRFDQAQKTGERLVTHRPHAE